MSRLPVAVLADGAPGFIEPVSAYTTVYIHVCARSKKKGLAVLRVEKRVRDHACVERGAPVTLKHRRTISADVNFD